MISAFPSWLFLCPSADVAAFNLGVTAGYTVWKLTLEGLHEMVGSDIL